jgi:hypothetical protein
VLFGGQDGDNYYYVMFNRTAANTQLFKVVGGVRQPALATGNYAIPDNEYHPIEVSRAGSLITVKADGAVVMQANDTTFGAGRIGIGAFNDAAWWDDIAIGLPATFSAVDAYLGDAANWEPLNASRWAVVVDGGNLRYGINTTAYAELPGSQLGEYSLVKGRTYGDFAFSARVRTSEDLAANASADYAVLFGGQDASNYYYAMFNRTAAYTQLFKVVDGVRQPALADGNYAIPDNEYHQIEVARAGSLITVMADGAVIMQASDATFGAGRIGIGAFNDAALWDDVAISLPVTDTSPPSTPTNVAVTALSFSEAAVSWSASSDDVGVVGYRVYRDGTLVASPTGTSASVTGLAGGVLYAFSVAAVDAAGNTSAHSAPVLVTTPVLVPPTISLAAAPTTIAAGQSATLTWSSTNAISCTASDGWSGIRSTSGSQAVTPAATTTYILTCTGLGGVASTSALVNVTPPPALPTVSLSASPASIAAGESSTLTWSSTNAGSCNASGGWSGARATSGSQSVSPASTTSYALSCSGAGGSASQSATVTVTATSGEITPVLVPSRVSGVAPLYVFFDATATTAAATNRPFHELEYRWDFGDTASGSWTSTPGMPNLSRNQATGPVAAHVFESPGTYTVSLTVLDGSGTATRSVQITVGDPDTAFAASTLCVGNTSPLAGSGGCPAGAAVLASSDFDAAINGNIASRKRILFRRGDTFTSNDNANVRLNGPGLIGAFGSGAAPRVNITGNNYAIQLSSGTTAGIRDWRIMDLEINGNSGSQTNGVQAEGGIDQVTLLRLNIHHVHFGVQLSPFILDYYGGQHRLWDQFAVVDSTIRTIVGGGGGYGLYVGAQRFTLMGNVLSDSSASEHILRTPNIVKAVISHNDMSLPAPAKHVVKLQAHVFDVSPTGFSEEIVMSDNKFTGGAGADWTVTLGPENAQSNEKVRQVIVERNWFAPHAGQGVALMLWTQEVTVRNNIFNLTGTGGTGITVERRGVEPPPANVHVYNNTFYSGSSGGFRPIQFAEGGGMMAKNNLGYAPLSSSRDMISGSATAQNNTTDAGILVSPGFLDATPLAPVEFVLGAGSPAGNAGTAVPVFSDFFRLERPQGSASDLGATEGP